MNAQQQANRPPSASLFLGGTNSSTFVASTGSGEAIRITNLTGPDFLITSFSLLYKTGQDNAQCELIDVQKNRPIIIGNVQICTIGAVKGTAIVLPRMKLETPFVLKSGQIVVLNIRNTSLTQIDPGDLALTLNGKQFI